VTPTAGAIVFPEKELPQPYPPLELPTPAQMYEDTSALMNDDAADSNGVRRQMKTINPIDKKAFLDMLSLSIYPNGQQLAEFSG
jgi:hypothetical protein